MPSAERERNVAEADENEPLLQQDQDTNKFLHRGASTPLPRAQLATIYAIKLVLPVAHTQIMPYFNKMVAGFNLPGDKSVGYYSGVLGTAHTIGQFTSIYAWGRLSDWIGRTPVIAVGTTGLGFSTLLFGSSQTFAAALAARILTGVFTGYVGVIHSVVGELSDTSNQSTAFPFYDIISALGFVIGPIIGGTFAEPAVEFPGWFDTPFFRKYPYILPCIVANLLCILAAFASIYFLRETHPHKAKRGLPPPPPPAEEEPEAYASLAGEEPVPVPETPPSLRSLLALPVIRALCSSQFMLGFLAACFNSVFVLQAYTPIEDGGLSMNPRKIAGALSIMGLVSIVLKASLPIFLRRYDALHVFRFTLLTWPLTFVLLPLLNVIARASGPERSARAEAVLWIAISFVLFMSRLGSLAFSIVMILTKDHTPTTMALGTTNSLSELFQMIGIAIGAPFISSMFAFSISLKVSGGQLWAIVICVLSLLGDYSASRMAKHRFA